MNKDTLTVGVVGLVAGALGSLAIAFFGTPAEAREGAAAGRSPYVVQLGVSDGGVGLLGAGDDPAINGVLFRLWSDGSVDSLAFVALTPKKAGLQKWSLLCEEDLTSPSKLCLQPLGVVPDDRATPADVNGDGTVDAADLGLVLGDWSGKPTAK